MVNFTKDELQAALKPIGSLIAKSEKAQRKLPPGTWQHTMLGDHLMALHMAAALMTLEPESAYRFAREDLDAALLAIASMIGKTEKAQAMFKPGTSQHSLQTNRLRALKTAESYLRKVLRERG